jgi:valyl-tRNA synthetase
MNNGRSAQQVTTALNNMNAQIKPLTEVNAHLNTGAAAMRNNQPGNANRSAAAAASKLENVSKNLGKVAEQLGNVAKNTGNKKYVAAANHALRATNAAKKAAITDVLAHIAETAKQIGEATVSAGVNINRKN